MTQPCLIEPGYHTFSNFKIFMLKKCNTIINYIIYFYLHFFTVRVVFIINIKVN